MKTNTQFILAMLALISLSQTEVLSAQEPLKANQVKFSQQQKMLININSASLKDLELLPGIGKTLAIRIIERRKIKPFQTIDDLKYVDGIGDKKFKELQAMIRVK